MLPIAGFAVTNTPEVAIKNYYEIPALFNQILSKYTDEEIVKKEFKSSLKNILTGEQLESWSRFIGETSTRSTFYGEAFSGLISASPLKILDIEINGNKSKARVKLTTKHSYSGSQNLPSIEYLFEKYHISNMKLDDLKKNEKTTPVPEVITYEVTSDVIDTLELVKIDALWKVTNISKKIVNSELNVIMP